MYRFCVCMLLLFCVKHSQLGVGGGNGGGCGGGEGLRGGLGSGSVFNFF